MTSGGQAGQSGCQPAGLVVVRVPSRPAVVLTGPAGSPSACRVEQPDRLLRVWGALSAASGELHKVKLQSEALPRLQRQLEAAAAELRQSVSPALAGELDRLTRHDDTAPTTTGRLRIEYATLLGWTGGLVIAMLDQLQRGEADTIAQPTPPASPASHPHQGGNRSPATQDPLDQGGLHHGLVPPGPPEDQGPCHEGSWSSGPVGNRTCAMGREHRSLAVVPDRGRTRSLLVVGGNMADHAGRSPRALVSLEYFLALAERALARRRRTGADVAVVAVGVEETGASATGSRPAGDALLSAVAEWILADPGPGDAAAVTDRGEVVILCGQLAGSWEADPIVRRARDMTGCPVPVGRAPVPVVSVSGVAMASCPQDTAATLVTAAGQAMRAQRAT